MANTDAPFGFRPVMHKSGQPYNGAANLYMATNGAALFVGDAVLITGESNAAEIDGNPPGSVPIINAPGTNNTSKISGVVVGIVPRSADDPVYRAASKVNRLVWVADDPNLMFEVQTDASITNDAIGAATSLITTHTGSTVTGRSAQEVNGTTATQGVFVIERVVPKSDGSNELSNGNCKVLVTVRKHTRNQSAANDIAGLGLGIL